jgi:hypothetical protein
VPGSWLPFYKGGKKMKYFLVIVILALLLAACESIEPTVPAGLITVQYTDAASPWLSELSACAGDMTVNAVPRAANLIDLQSTDMAIVVGSTPGMNLAAYQIDEEELLVILNAQNPVKSLTAEQTRDLFTGLIKSWDAVDGLEAPVEVWVFSIGEDIQQIFTTTFLAGSAVTSDARLATSMEEMRQAIAGNVNAVGLLTGSWTMDDLTTAFSISDLPVLVLTQGEPPDTIQGVISCLQR